MLGLDPAIVEHHIETWLDASPVRQKQHSLNLVKAPAIEVEIEKLRRIGFIYPIVYMSSVSNPIPINKKQDNINIFIDYHDLNFTCPKYNYPMPFIDQVIDEWANHEILSFMYGFSVYIQIQIWQQDQYRMTFTTPWGTFTYCIMPFSLKNIGTTFQCTLS